MNRRTLFQALVGSAAASTVAASPAVEARKPIGWWRYKTRPLPESEYLTYWVVADVKQWGKGVESILHGTLYRNGEDGRLRLCIFRTHQEAAEYRLMELDPALWSKFDTFAVRLNPTSSSVRSALA